MISKRYFTLILFLVFFSFWHINVFGQNVKRDKRKDIVVLVSSEDKRVKAICENGEITEFRIFPNGYESEKVRDSVKQFIADLNRKGKTKEYFKKNKPLLIDGTPTSSSDVGFAYHFRVIKKERKYSDITRYKTHNR